MNELLLKAIKTKWRKTKRRRERERESNDTQAHTKTRKDIRRKMEIFPMRLFLLLLAWLGHRNNVEELLEMECPVHRGC